jgi:dethiobiotin synthetase
MTVSDKENVKGTVPFRFAGPVIVSGTDTGVGKTVVTAALAALHPGAAVVKPAQTGVAPGEPGDLEEVRRLSGATDLHELARYPDPLAPASAARRAGLSPLGSREIAQYVRGLDNELVLVEGAGGLLVRFDDAGGTIADVAALLDAPVVVVARAGLGTLNHTALTCEALRARGLRCAGIVIGSWPSDPDLASRCNLDDLAAYAGVPVIGRMPEGAGRLTPAEFSAVARESMEVEIPV